jgi:hypothetical protein
MHPSNVIALFGGYDEAHHAVQDLLSAGLGEIQVRIVPPPSVARHQWRVVSVIVNSNHARDAEAVLRRTGSVDLVEEAESRARRSQGYHRRETWDVDTQRNRSPMMTGSAENWNLRDVPWGTIAGAAVAIASGLALLRGAQEWYARDNGDYAPGNRHGRHFPAGNFQSNMDYQSKSRFSRDHNGDKRRGRVGQALRTQIDDESGIPLGDADADRSGARYDRPAGSGSFQSAARGQGGSTGVAGSGTPQGLTELAKKSSTSGQVDPSGSATFGDVGFGQGSSDHMAGSGSGAEDDVATPSTRPPGIHIGV